MLIEKSQQTRGHSGDQARLVFDRVLAKHAFLCLEEPEGWGLLLRRGKRDAQGAYTNAKWEEVNFKLDSPQSESDRGESQVKIERAKWW